MQPVEVFFSYSHKDQHFRDQLETQLSLLKREGLISSWHDRKIDAGEEWAGKIDEHLNSAQIILLLISADFIASDYCYDIEMKRALERYEAGEAYVIPVILRWVDWRNTSFGKLQALPRDAKPVTSWIDCDEAFFDITQGIRKIVEQLSLKRNNIQHLPLIHHEVNPLPFQLMSREDLGDAPNIENFYGRVNELSKLKQWIINDRARAVILLGIAGIGKTTLAVKIVEAVKDEFEYIIWRSLKNTPYIEDVLNDYIKFLSDQKQIILSKDVNSQVALLIEYLRRHRCLLVLDNVESVLSEGSLSGEFREGYEGYSRLIHQLGLVQHQSCLLLTSREKPKEIALLEGNMSPIRSLLLPGLGQLEGQKILKNKDLFGSERTYEELLNLYSGNPLSLKVVSAVIREVFKGDIAEFLKNEEGAFGDIYVILDQQFQRLSELEREIMYWLGIEREGKSLDDVSDDIVRPVPKGALLVALDSLRRRSMIEISGTTYFTLQPVIMEYVTDGFVEKIYEEIDRGTLELFESHALIKANAKDYIRDGQIRLILKPLAKRLFARYGKERTEKKLRDILSMLQEIRPQVPGYAGGNVLNLLVQLDCNLRGYDFSRLAVWTAYMQGVALPEVNFSHADLAKSVFTDTLRTVITVALSPNGEILAAGTANGEIRLWHFASGTPLLTWKGHTDWTRSVTFSPDGNTLASSGDDHSIRLWEVSTGQCLKTLQGHEGRVYSVVFSPDGNTLASGSDDKTIRLWEVSTGQCLKTLQGHDSWVFSVAFNPDGSTLVSGSEDQTIRLWEVSTGQCLKTLQGHEGRVYSVVFSPDGNTLASGSDDKTIRLWEVSTGQCLKTLQGHTQWIWSVAFSPDGSTLASGSEDQTIRLWEVSTGQCLKTLQGHTNLIRSVAFSPDGSTLVSGSDDQSIRLWEVSKGQCFKTLQGHSSWVWTTSYSPDGNTLASGGDDKSIRLWEVSTGQCLKTLQGHTNWIWSVAFSPDGSILASSSSDQTIRLWEVSTGQCLKTLQGHTQWIWSVAFSPDGSTLASGSEDQTARLWEVSTGQCLKILRGDDKQVRIRHL